MQWISVGETNLVIHWHCAKKVVFDSPGLVDFAIGSSESCSLLAQRD